MVVLTAYAAELRCENNELIAGNKTLRGEVDTLSIKIKSSNSVANIEKEIPREWISDDGFSVKEEFIN